MDFSADGMDSLGRFSAIPVLNCVYNDTNTGLNHTIAGSLSDGCLCRCDRFNLVDSGL